jgi:hypothetical protein
MFELGGVGQLPHNHGFDACQYLTTGTTETWIENAVDQEYSSSGNLYAFESSLLDGYLNYDTGITMSLSGILIGVFNYQPNTLKATTTTLTNDGSPNPSTTTESLNYTATVTGGVPNGDTVTLEDASNNDAVVATGTTNNGTANFTVPAGTLLAGTHNLVAVYEGDSNFATSISPIFTQVVAQAATTTTLLNNGSLTSDATQALSFTATVSGGVPDGEIVTLEDASNNDAVVTSGTSSGGFVSFTVPAGALLAGTHNLIAIYGGDTNFSGSQSSTVAQNVQVVVTAVQVNGNIPSLAGVQRSMVDSILYTFSEPVNISGSNAFTIAVHAATASTYGGIVPNYTWTALNPINGSSTQWAVTFSGTGTVGKSIGNGVYDITMNASDVTSEANPTVAAQPRATDTFHRLFGDTAGNGKVKATQYNAFLAAFGTSPGQSGYNAEFDISLNGGLIKSTAYNDFLADLGLLWNVSSDTLTN